MGGWGGGQVGFHRQGSAGAERGCEDGLLWTPLCHRAARRGAASGMPHIHDLENDNKMLSKKNLT